MATEPTAKKTRKRRDYRKDFERLEFYLSTVIRIKGDGEPGEFTKGELKAYADVLDYIGSAK